MNNFVKKYVLDLFGSQSMITFSLGFLFLRIHYTGPAGRSEQAGSLSILGERLEEVIGIGGRKK